MTFSCQNGGCVGFPETGEPCTQGGVICAASGRCVECLGDPDCSGGAKCVEGTCEAPAPGCSNGALDPGETDVDCGGSCPRCSTGKTCATNADCTSKVCDNGNKCAAPTCVDNVKNQSESDVDCGGSCPDCPDGKACNDNNDCASGQCDNSTKKCVTKGAGCSDGVRNQKETDVDCGGGTCPPCATGKKCAIDADCSSKVCAAGLCAAPSCKDGKKNGAETDVDCGGPSCSPCGDGAACVDAADCSSGVCTTTGVCATSSCTDKVRNGDETDVDCGGATTCSRCADGKSCNAPADCQSGVCDAVSSTCSAPACDDGVKNGGESDVDCGFVCSGCAGGKACGATTDCAAPNLCVNGKCGG